MYSNWVSCGCGLIELKNAALVVWWCQAVWPRGVGLKSDGIISIRVSCAVSTGSGFSRHWSAPAVNESHLQTSCLSQPDPIRHRDRPARKLNHPPARARAAGNGGWGHAGETHLTVMWESRENQCTGRVWCMTSHDDGHSLLILLDLYSTPDIW